MPEPGKTIENEEEMMPEAGLFDSAPDEAVMLGTCVMILEGDIVYAGPIKGAPSTSGRLVLLNPIDFERLKTVVDRGRH